MSTNRYSFCLTVIILFCSLNCCEAQEAIPPQYIVDTVREPLFDMIRLDVGIKALGNKKLAALGYVDVTAAPFNADPTGRTDSTKALQRAIQYACTNQMACFFPPGTYLVSNTLSCVQPLYRRQNGKLGSARSFPNVLVGTSADRKKRAVIRLAPSSPGYSDVSKPKYVVHFWVRDEKGLEQEYKPSGNVSFSQLLVNIDISIGENNPGAVGVRHRAAQGSSVQECTIDATYGLKGLEGGAGSGGSHHRVTVIGGEIGMDFTESQPAPTVSGCAFMRQRKHALIYSGMETLCMVGCTVEQCGDVAIVGKAQNKQPNEGLIVIADSIFDLKRMPIVRTERSVYIADAYARNTSAIVMTPLGTVNCRDGWQHIRECAVSIDPPECLGKQYRTAVRIDGAERNVISDVTDGEPPDGFIKRHLWNDTPSWEHPDAVNVKTAYHAAGDGVADDTAVLQKAIDEKEILFFPKGIYRITRTLRLRPRSKLIGISEQFSLITTAIDTPFFADVRNQKPLLETADAAEANTMLAFIGTYVPTSLTGSYDLLWRSGGASMLRSYCAHHVPWNGYGYSGKQALYEQNIGATVIVTGNGGGRWYNWYGEAHGMVWGKTAQDKRFRQIIIRNTSQPIRFYQLNPEGSESAARVEIDNAAPVYIYGMKSEGNHPVLWAHDTEELNIFGYGGNGTALPGNAMFRFENVKRLLVANAMPRPMKPGQKLLGLSVSQDPSAWTLIADTFAGKTFGTKPLERPVVYRCTQR
ncbi:MAG: hypothetical protein A2283_15010 [Lentisphaerae bacterium RIFOXYA12_FULL_48_11]|nr:MAG: hypothetical protein A2283_15010 [Lentisphaerae bacterium RIFOXYA12_FULL_48_11]